MGMRHAVKGQTQEHSVPNLNAFFPAVIPLQVGVEMLGRMPLTQAFLTPQRIHGLLITEGEWRPANAFAQWRIALTFDPISWRCQLYCGSSINE